MARLLKNGSLFLDRRFVKADVLIKENGVFVFDKSGDRPPITEAGCDVTDLDGKFILPGFADVHVHFREPGLSYKETIRTGSEAAAAGGYTCVCPMPNVDPRPENLDKLSVELDIIKRDAAVRVIPYGAITRPASGGSMDAANGGPASGVGQASGGSMDAANGGPAGGVGQASGGSMDAANGGPAGGVGQASGGAAGSAADGQAPGSGEGKRELADMESMASLVVAFSDDGKGVQTGGLMRDAMELAKSLGKIITAHCEDESLLMPGGAIHDGRYAKEHGFIGICSASEWKQVERDVKLADETGCAYHVCHVSTKESVEILRDAKRSGVDVSCETAPHYLILTEDDLIDDGRFKMNPPLREAADREALLEGVCDGTIDIIATDHAPHSAEEKSRGLAKSPFGIVGLETAFPMLNTRLVEGGVISFDRLMELIAGAPRKRFGLPGAESLDGGSFVRIQSESAGGGCEGNVNYKDVEDGTFRIFKDLTVVDPEREHTIDPEGFRSKGRATPFAGEHVKGRVEMTVCDGKVVYER